MQKTYANRWRWIAVVFCLVGIAVAIRIANRPHVPNKIDDVPDVKIDAASAVKLLNSGVALMENGQYDAAAETFGELAKGFSDEVVVMQNHAVASVLAIAPETLDKVRNVDKFQSGLARASAAVAKLLDAKQNSMVAHLLAAKLEEHRENRKQQLDELELAAKLSNGDAAFETEIYVAARTMDDAELLKLGSVALRRASDKEPDNLWLLTERLVVEATENDAEITKTLARTKAASGPFVEFIKKLRNIDLIDFLAKAEEAVGKQDWNTVTRNVRLVGNMLKPEIATKLDQRRVSKHLLEYVDHDFSPEWRAKHATELNATNASVPKPIPVEFATADALDQLPALSGIRDAKIVDFNLDGRWDVVVLLSGQVIVFGQAVSEGGERKGENGSRWITMCEGVVPSGMTKLLVCDLDRDTEETPDEHRFVGQRTSKSEKPPEGASERAEDADPDVLVYGSDGVQFLRNVLETKDQTRSLQQIAQPDGLDTLRDVLAIAPADIDHDGDLDLVVSSGGGMSIWQNNDSREQTKFIDISARSSLPPKELRATVLLPVDWNFDVQTDVLVSGSEVTKPGFLENISHGRLRWREWSDSEWNVANVRSLHVMGLQTTKLKWDLLGSRTQETRLWDFDNDGQRDRLEWDSQNVFRKPLDASGESIDQPLLNDSLANAATCEVADFDSDGDEDVLVVTNDRPIWVRNDGGNKNGWIDLSIRADKDRKPQRDSERVNSHGLGSLVELRAVGLPELTGRKMHVRVVDSQSTHFGLGSVQEVDAARILWTNGVPQNVLKPKSRQAIAAQQILKGSCPYIYTWDGEQWAFFTDCLWAAPIGLQLAEGVLAQAREWEYLKIDGDRLRETDGEYRVMLTEELWEAAYFDQVRLLAIDHPADVDFFSNEKVGPPKISEFRLHPVRKKQSPISAVDHRGRDVLPKINRRDEQYLRAFDKIIQQGLAEEHFIELDFGDLRGAKKVTLFLTGWIFPTDTSINVSLSQNPDLPGPKPPSIWVPKGTNELGKWHEAIPYIGFPGGKTKTIAVDVTDAIGQSRAPRSSLRIVTSMELYWDEMFFTVDEPDFEHTVTELPLVSADLQFRGFSDRLAHPEFGPERYDANAIRTETHWPPMGGKFTRYGDVTELLSAADDRMAVLGAGDAMAIRFRAAKPLKDLPPGWKRDFIIHNVGWDKDADLNTIYGQFVEPLPFRAMRGYPDVTGEEFPDSPVHREYLQRFQTREQNRAAFWGSREIPRDAKSP